MIINNLANPLAGIGVLNRKISESKKQKSPQGQDESVGNVVDNSTQMTKAPMLKSFKNELEGSDILSEDANDDQIVYGRTSVEELEVELRQKYITILKSIYWEFYEEG